MSAQFPPGSHTPEKPFTDTAGVKWVVYTDDVTGNDWRAAPLSVSNPYNLPAFDGDMEEKYVRIKALSPKAAMLSINQRATTYIKARLNERESSSGSTLFLALLAAFFLFGKKGR